MEIIRRNTDYGLRMMTVLAKRYRNGDLVSASQLVRQSNISYEVGRKLLQLLRRAKLVKSVMGSKGGFALSRKPSEISLMDVVNVLQGNLCLNVCLADDKECELEPKCGLNTAFEFAQHQLDDYLQSVTLEKILEFEELKKKE